MVLAVAETSTSATDWLTAVGTVAAATIALVTVLVTAYLAKRAGDDHRDEMKRTEARHAKELKEAQERLERELQANHDEDKRRWTLDVLMQLLDEFESNPGAVLQPRARSLLLALPPEMLPGVRSMCGFHTSMVGKTYEVYSSSPRDTAIRWELAQAISAESHGQEIEPIQVSVNR